ncbi:MAG: adenylate/guanylate cyclase domain-containing protein [Leptospiraceae bacterium]|nr:adenylate/guanylate cyclase domain-containing protein [Leptospiraceae bacterium]
MIIFRTIILFLIVLFLTCSEKKKLKKPPLAIKGVIDLTNWDFEKDGSVSLIGEWEFYWSHFLNPQENDNLLKPNYTNIPHLWNDIVGYSNFGFASYRLKVITKKEKDLALVVGEQNTAFDFYLNKLLVSSSGKPAKTRDETIPSHYSFVQKLTLIDTIDDKQEYEIILNLSNFHSVYGGFWNFIRIDLEKNIYKQREYNLSIDFFLIGSLVMFSFYHFGLFLNRRRDTSPLYFGLFCIIIAFRISVVGNRFLIQFFPDISWIITRKIDFFSFYFAVPIWTLFTNNFFKLNKTIMRGGIIFGSLLSLCVIILPERIYELTLVPYQIFFVLFIGYVIVVVFLALFRKEEFAFPYLLGGGIFFLFAILDIIRTVLLLDTPNLAPFGLFIFTFIQSYILSQKFSISFLKSENLAEALFKLNSANSKFVPTEFLSLLEKKDITEIKLGEKIQQDMTILFSDIRNFTELSETMSADENFKFINAYLKRMGPIIRSNNGFIDKYIGDSIMALFSGQVSDSINAALEIQKALTVYNKERVNDKYEPFQIGIGIHKGNLMLGTIGESERMEGTVISDAVNLASRLEGLTKIYGCSIIISESTFFSVADHSNYKYRILDTIRVKGKKEPVTIFQIFSEKEIEQFEDFEKIKSMYEKALDFYRSQNFKKTISICEEILSVIPIDKPTEVLLHKTKILINENFNGDWDSITTLIEK